MSAKIQKVFWGYDITISAPGICSMGIWAIPTLDILAKLTRKKCTWHMAS